MEKQTFTAKQIEDKVPLLCMEDEFLVGVYGEYTKSYKVILPEIFTLSEEEYEFIHETILKALKLLPQFTIVHKQDWFIEEKYQPVNMEDSTFLSRSFERHFYDRPFLNHYCYLHITKSSKQNMSRKSSQVSLLRGRLVQKEFLSDDVKQAFEESLGQMQRILEDSGLIKLIPLGEKDLLGDPDTGEAGLIDRYLNVSTEKKPMLHDYDLRKGLKIGEKHFNCFTISDLDELPHQIAPDRRYEKYCTDKTNFRLGFANAVGLNLSCNHIYNQYLFIEDSGENLQKFEKKVRNLHSLSRYSRENTINRELNEEYLNEAVENGYRSIRAHFNLFVWTENPVKLPELRNMASSAIAAMDVKPRLNTIDCNKLFFAGIPGCSVDFPNEESFYTFFEQAVCLFNMETCYQSSSSSFGLKMVDRMSMKPVFIDISEEPYQKGIITNRNKIILGPSGSGKSFFTNHMVRQYFDQGGHVLLVDTGNSYLGLCNMIRQKTGGKDGIYFTYTKEDPISFNPFYTDDGEFDIEKTEIIIAVLLTLWKKDTDPVTRSEEVSLRDAVKDYFDVLSKSKAQEVNIEPCFNTFYEFVRSGYRKSIEGKKGMEFDIDKFLYNLSPYYRGGAFDYLLNNAMKLDLLNKRFIVFELDQIKDNPILFPVVTLIIMETFINKMRRLKGVRKMILIEEAWKAIAKQGMAEYIKYLFKTVRKFQGEAVVVTQEVDDIIHSAIVKDTIVANSDCKILLDQRKYLNKFEQIQALLGLTDKEKQQILSINQDLKPGYKYKEVWIGLGGQKSAVYATEVSLEEYAAYTTEEKEKVEVFKEAERYGGDIEMGLKVFAGKRRKDPVTI